MALAEAKKVLSRATGGAAGLTYDLAQVSLLQVARSPSSAAVRFVRRLGEKQGSAMLGQLAARMASALHSEADVFAKIKGLISDMGEKLEAEAEADATEKAYCDKELGESNAKKDDKTAEIEKLTAKIDSMSSQSKKLKGEIATLQEELGELTKSQAEMDKLRAEEKALFEANSAETEKGLNGVKLALKVLNEYYAKADKAHSSADGASSGIIGLLEVCESDFSKALTEMTAAEEAAQNQYDAQTKENEITKATKDQDVKYKTKESNGLDKSVAEYSSDKAGVETELSAVNEYLSQLEGRCIAKAETYGERKARREAEINGLKEALTVLENETAL